MTAPKQKAEVLDQAGLDRALTRIAHEIVEQAGGADLALVGIKTRGETLAGRIAEKIAGIEGKRPAGKLHVEAGARVHVPVLLAPEPDQGHGGVERRPGHAAPTVPSSRERISRSSCALSGAISMRSISTGALAVWRLSPKR